MVRLPVTLMTGNAMIALLMPNPIAQGDGIRQLAKSLRTAIQSSMPILACAPVSVSQGVMPASHTDRERVVTSRAMIAER